MMAEFSAGNRLAAAEEPAANAKDSGLSTSVALVYNWTAEVKSTLVSPEVGDTEAEYQSSTGLSVMNTWNLPDPTPRKHSCSTGQAQIHCRMSDSVEQGRSMLRYLSVAQNYARGVKLDISEVVLENIIVVFNTQKARDL